MLTDDLINSYDDKFSSTISHPLVQQLCAGTLPDKTLFIYLTQDLKYFALYLKIILKTAYLCKDEATTIRFGKQIGFITNDENDYFEKTVNFLLKRDPSLKKYQDKSFIPHQVKEYINFLEELAARLEDYSYNQLVTYLWTTEIVYLRWAQLFLATPDAIPKDLHWRFREWIDLHSIESFEEYVIFLQRQVDGISDRNEVEEIFRKTVNLEYGFFEGSTEQTR
ncbi:DEKNAAC105107 [Brettanomyces naardenensis]|uniref:DEKNAAC105107 n=1 Tax=Brettanomyces naardenensis TaxID=13370 RepID=A0A448YST7_BRENA|nr:DEKNAAC105107 [Brettanomyces naardenensis]